MSARLDALRRTWRRLLEESDSPRELAAAVSLGTFLAVTPFYGLQTIMTVALATWLRLNKVAAVAASQITFPPVYPFFVLASLEAGSLILHGEWFGSPAPRCPGAPSRPGGCCWTWAGCGSWGAPWSA